MELVGVVRTHRRLFPSDLAADEFLQRRGFFSEVEVNGNVLFDVGAPVRFSATPLRPGRKAPVAGADNAEVLGASTGTDR